ncbi:hypothetical protein MRX96_029973 [Rhipicephalus microplus]
MTKLFKTVCAATQVPIQDAISEGQVRTHPNSNIALFSTPSRARAEAFNNIKILKIRDEEIEVVAHAPAPENSTKGVIYYACSDETGEAIFMELQTENPSTKLVAVRKVGRKHIVAVFAGTECPEHVRYWGDYVCSHPFKEQIGACFNCRRTRHWADVCPQERQEKCKCCGEETHETPAWGTNPYFIARCIVCEEERPARGRNCKYKYYSQVPQKGSTDATNGMPSILKDYNDRQGRSRPGDTATQLRMLSTCCRDDVRNNQTDQAGSINGAHSSSRGRCNSRGCHTNRSPSKARNQPKQRDARWLPVGPRDETNTEGQYSNTERQWASEVRELRKQPEAANRKIQGLERAKSATLANYAREVDSSEFRDSAHLMETEKARTPTRKLIEEDKEKHEDYIDIARRVDVVENTVATMSKEIDKKMRAIRTSIQETLKTFHERLSSEITRMLSNVSSRDYSQATIHLPLRDLVKPNQVTRDAARKRTQSTSGLNTTLKRMVGQVRIIQWNRRPFAEKRAATAIRPCQLRPRYRCNCPAGN